MTLRAKRPFATRGPGRAAFGRERLFRCRRTVATRPEREHTAWRLCGRETGGRTAPEFQQSRSGCKSCHHRTEPGSFFTRPASSNFARSCLSISTKLRDKFCFFTAFVYRFISSAPAGRAGPASDLRGTAATLGRVDRRPVGSRAQSGGVWCRQAPRCFCQLPFRVAELHAGQTLRAIVQSVFEDGLEQLPRLPLAAGIEEVLQPNRGPGRRWSE